MFSLEFKISPALLNIRASFSPSINSLVFCSKNFGMTKLGYSSLKANSLRVIYSFWGNSLFRISKNWFISGDLQQKLINFEMFILSSSYRLLFKNSLMSFWITSFIILHILNVEATQQFNMYSKSMKDKEFNSFKSKMSKRNLTFSSNFDFETKTSPENNSKLSINPFSLLSHNLNIFSLYFIDSSVWLNISLNSFKSIEKFSQTDLKVPWYSLNLLRVKLKNGHFWSNWSIFSFI